MLRAHARIVLVLLAIGAAGAVPMAGGASGLQSTSYSIPIFTVDSGSDCRVASSSFQGHSHVGELGGAVHSSTSFRLLAGFSGQLGWYLGGQGGAIRLNEIRTDQTGTDSDEYFELTGPAGASLSGTWYVVIGDLSSVSGGCGNIECIVDLSPYSIQSDGYVAFTDTDAGTDVLTGYDVILGGTNALNFENSDNVTHLLVSGFTGTMNQDLDLDDDGIFDVTPWTAVVDGVSLITPLSLGCAGVAGTSELHYAAGLGLPVVGPDGSFVPGHVYACPDVPGEWGIGPFNPAGGLDTVGGPNPFCTAQAPVFVGYAHAPCVPETGQPADLSVAARFADAASVSYTVDGGPPTDLIMSIQATNGDTTWFAASFPGQPADGTLVEYVITATNANPDTTSSPRQGYFVGTTLVASLRVNDPSGANVYRYYYARVTGNITVPYGAFSDIRTDGYIQDITGGINLFEFDLNPVFASAPLGGEITASGMLDQYNGKLELTSGGACDSLAVELVGPGSPVPPLYIGPCDLTEGYEGTLARMYYAQIPALLVGTTMLANQSLRIQNCGSQPDLDVFLDGDSDFAGNTIVSSTYEVVGIVTQFGGLLTDYDIAPRFFSDLTPLYIQVGMGDETAKPVMQLLQNVPNPFSSTTEIRYVVPQAGEATDPVPVLLSVFDVRGRRIASVVDALQVPGEYGVNVDVEALRRSGTGVYFYRLDIGGRTITRKLILQ